jgi:hypothetical protein
MCEDGLVRRRVDSVANAEFAFRSNNETHRLFAGHLGQVVHIFRAVRTKANDIVAAHVVPVLGTRLFHLDRVDKAFFGHNNTSSKRHKFSVCPKLDKK